MPETPVTDALGLTGKTAVVIGAAPGMGLECARHLALAGATIVCVDIDGAVATAAAEDIAARGGRAIALCADALDRVSVQAAFDVAIDETGRFDVLVNVVGLSRVRPFAALTDAEWAAQIDINLTHQFIVAQEAVLRMRPRGGGAIIMLGSVAGHGSSPLMAAYGAAKAGLIGLAHSIAIEHASDGIRCNVVSPGATLTPRMRQAFGSGEKLAAFSAAIPLGRPGEPEEIAKAVLFLASDLASYVTAQTVVCDGGSLAKFALPQQ
jgi:NAD(P)-dependent dehydrogenase (short-subunit alcohol dehydrogenase family)